MEEYEVIRIPVSDGTEKEFAIMDTFTVEEKHYMAVSLIEEDEILVFLFFSSKIAVKGVLKRSSRTNQLSEVNL